MMHQNLGTSSKTATGASVLSLLQAGKLELADREARRLIERSPKDQHAQYARGLVSLMLGDAAGSIPWLKKAQAQNPNNATYCCNLGVAYLRAGEIDAAIAHLKRALERKPNYREARYSLGCALLDNQQPDGAAIQFTTLLDENPRDAKTICSLGDVARAKGDWSRAARLYRDALALDPTTVRAWTNLAPILMHSDRIDEAIESCLKAIELDPAEFTARKNLGDCLIRQEAFEEAMGAYADAFELDADSADLCVAIGRVWFETGEPGEASTWFHKAIQIDADHIDAQCCCADLLRDHGENARALEILQPLLEKEPENPTVLIAIADAMWEDGDAAAAVELLRRVQTIQPSRITLYGKLGHILSSSGDVDGAIEQYREALDRNPACIPALIGMATTQRGKLDLTCAERMENLLDQDGLRSGALGSLHSGLAYYYDGREEHERAAHHMQQANSRLWESRTKRGWQYDPEERKAHVTRLIKTFDGAYFERVRGLGNPDATPIFIVGMPRSGTTLTEQILARHSKVLGVGERPFVSQSFNQFCRVGSGDGSDDFSRLESIARKEVAAASAEYLGRLQQLKDKANHVDAERVVDKMPDNYGMLGWILTLFPKARIIHCRRDPRDVALSCWMTQFGAIRWACHEEHLIQRIREYQRLMDHWRQLIPEKFIELNYEDLVANQEAESRRLVEWIGLDWEPECLSFYDSDRLVKTASITQVRQPIYNQSVAKWEKYAAYLPGLFESLAPSRI